MRIWKYTYGIQKGHSLMNIAKFCMRLSFWATYRVVSTQLADWKLVKGAMSLYELMSAIFHVDKSVQMIKYSQPL